MRPVHAAMWASPFTQQLPAMFLPSLAQPSSKALLPSPHTQALSSAGTHRGQTDAQDTVACDLLPFVLTLVSWCLQVNEGDGFFISDPLLQVELDQVQHLWKTQGTGRSWGMAPCGKLGAEYSHRAA